MSTLVLWKIKCSTNQMVQYITSLSTIIAHRYFPNFLHFSFSFVAIIYSHDKIWKKIVTSAFSYNTKDTQVLFLSLWFSTHDWIYSSFIIPIDIWYITHLISTITNSDRTGTTTKFEFIFPSFLFLSLILLLLMSLQSLLLIPPFLHCNCHFPQTMLLIKSMKLRNNINGLTWQQHKYEIKFRVQQCWTI